MAAQLGSEQLTAREAGAEDARCTATGNQATAVPSTVPSRAAHPRPGAAPTHKDGSCTHVPWLCSTSSNGTRADGWM